MRLLHLFERTGPSLSHARGLVLLVVWASVATPVTPAAGAVVHLSGLQAPAQVTRDRFDVAHLAAQTEQDLFFLQGYVHAQDRLFQMDVSRRLAGGRLAELLGEGALPTDVQLRTIGLHRAAARSLAVLSPRVRAALEAYAAGVNQFVQSGPLPPEYAALEISQVEPWSPVDSVAVAKLITFQRSFDIDVATTVNLLTYQQAGQAVGFNGTALYFEDLFRAAPFDPTTTLAGTAVEPAARAGAPRAEHRHHVMLQLCRRYLDSIKDLPVFRDLLERGKRPGSNEWAVRGSLSVNGHAMLANDAHLSLGVPSLFYPIHLKAGRMNVAGSSVAGVPFVILGHNRKVGWGATVNYVDVTDTFQEQLRPDPGSPSGLSTVYAGQTEPIIPIPEVFRKNNFDGVSDNLSVVPPGEGIPPATLIVPRRNQGPIVQLDLANGTALSVQYTGFSPTRELETFLEWNEARDMEDFLHGLQFFDVGSINWAYLDVRGNIAFFSSSEVPVREDLQAGTVRGLPPWFIRNGTGGNEWLPVQHPQPGQAVPYEILPFAEMPQVINPASGWFVNANNDPVGLTLDNQPLNRTRPGGGIYYLASFHEGYRAGRITQLLREKLSRGTGRVSLEDMTRIQADTVLIDAEVFVPYLLQAYVNGHSGAGARLAALAADERLVEAVARLSAWDFTTPTGIPEGYDASDQDGVLSTPSDHEIAASVAATIYSVWRGQFIRNSIDAPLTKLGLPVPEDQYALSALRHLLDNFADTGGVGASGLNFFEAPEGESAAERRDIVILQSLADALDLLAGEGFAAAFQRSVNQDDYRWGKLHRLTLSHPLGGPFNVPPAAGLWPAPLPGLEGIPVDGGFSTVDVGNPIGGVRGEDADAFMFDHGAAHRLICEATPAGIHGELSVPGGVSGVIGSPAYFNLLPGWLTNDAFPLLTRPDELQKNAVTTVQFVPGGP